MKRRLALLLVLMLLVAACGTRVSDDRIIAANGSATPASLPHDPSGDASPGASTTTSSSATVPSNASSEAQVTSPRAGSDSSPAATGPESATENGRAEGGGTGAVAACDGELDPVLVGQTGIFSGFLAPATAGFRTGLAVWAAEVNARGGVACHPVTLRQLDDAADPARAKANVRRLIEEDGAVALVGVAATITMQALRSEVDPREFPVIGGDLLATDWFQDPNLYPQGGTGWAGFVGPVQVNAQKGHKDFGVLYCVEVHICTGINDRADEIAKAAGANLVFTQSTSLTQTDYTAECQNAKSKGVDNLFIAADGSALARVARSCASIGYRPAFATVGIAAVPSLGDDPNVKAATLTIGAQNPPFPATDVPGMQAFHQAMSTYAPGELITQSTLYGYVSGRLFEVAVTAAGRSALEGPITTELVKQGLAKIKSETLDGLTAPLTFPAGKPTPTTDCYYVLTVDENGFSAPQGSEPNCL